MNVGMQLTTGLKNPNARAIVMLNAVKHLNSATGTTDTDRFY